METVVNTDKDFLLLIKIGKKVVRSEAFNHISRMVLFETVMNCHHDDEDTLILFILLQNNKEDFRTSC